MTISFDHSYTADPQHRFHKRLIKLGFKPVEDERVHPGGVVCRFIALRGENEGPRTYIEFVHMRPGGKPVKEPGLSFRASSKLEKYHKSLDSWLGGKFVHKNYDWEKDSESRLPGWNYLTFKKSPKGLYTWITEYEPRPGQKPKSTKTIKHPNGVKDVRALEFELNPQGQAFFEKLFKRKIGKSLKLQGLNLYFTPAKKNRLTAVVLEAKNVNSILRKYPVDGATTWRDLPAALIKNPVGMWDIIIVGAHV